MRRRFLFGILPLFFIVGCTNHWDETMDGTVDGRPMRCRVEIANPFFGHPHPSKIECTEKTVVVIADP